MGMRRMAWRMVIVAAMVPKIRTQFRYV